MSDGSPSVQQVTTTSVQQQQDSAADSKRFRGNWVPLIRDPARFSYLPSTTKALEKATEQHEAEQEKAPGPDKDAADPPAPVSPRERDPGPSSPRPDALLQDAVEARERVERLKRKHPGLDLDALCNILIENKCKQGAIVGICSAGPAVLMPGWGSLASVLLGGVADITLCTKLEVDLALEIAHLYGLFDVYCADPNARRNYLLQVAGLEGLDDSKIDEDDEKAMKQAGERLAVRATEELGKRSLMRYIPVVGATVSAGTNVVGIYVIGKRAQVLCKGVEPLGTWRESVNKYAVPADIAKAMATQIGRVPSAVTVRVAQLTVSIGTSARKLVSYGSLSN